ncbi:MAG: hypothetical protein SGCHY_001521 [Lobulomycetales sp.]
MKPFATYTLPRPVGQLTRVQVCGDWDSSAWSGLSVIRSRQQLFDSFRARLSTFSVNNDTLGELLNIASSRYRPLASCIATLTAEANAVKKSTTPHKGGAKREARPQDKQQKSLVESHEREAQAGAHSSSPSPENRGELAPGAQKPEQEMAQKSKACSAGSDSGKSFTPEKTAARQEHSNAKNPAKRKMNTKKARQHIVAPPYNSNLASTQPRAVPSQQQLPVGFRRPPSGHIYPSARMQFQSITQQQQQQQHQQHAAARHGQVIYFSDQAGAVGAAGLGSASKRKLEEAPPATTPEGQQHQHQDRPAKKNKLIRVPQIFFVQDHHQYLIAQHQAKLARKTHQSLPPPPARPENHWTQARIDEMFTVIPAEMARLDGLISSAPDAMNICDGGGESLGLPDESGSFFQTLSWWIDDVYPV